MCNIFNAVFYSFWTFIGTMMIVGLLVRGLVALAAVVRGMKVKFD